MEVTRRLRLNLKEARELINKRFRIVKLKETAEEIKAGFADYILDHDDAHIAAGAKAAEVKFLISYNIRHFKKDKLKEDFNIILSTPANLLQYLRSQ